MRNTALARRASAFPSIFNDLFGKDHYESALDDSFRQLLNEVVSDSNKLFSVFKGKMEYPKADVFSKDGILHFNLALPGIKQEEVDVSLEESKETKSYILTVKGTHKNKTIKSADASYFSELRGGSFERSWSIPFNINKDEINASMGDGILEISIPIIQNKPLEKEVRKILISNKENKSLPECV